MKIVPDEWSGKTGRTHIIKGVISMLISLVGIVYMGIEVGVDFTFATALITIAMGLFNEYSLTNLKRELE